MFGISSDDVKNLSIAGLLGNMISQADDPGVIGQLQSLLGSATKLGVASEKGGSFLDGILKK